jgi:hypothetical protein
MVLICLISLSQHSSATTPPSVLRSTYIPSSSLFMGTPQLTKATRSLAGTTATQATTSIPTTQSLSSSRVFTKPLTTAHPSPTETPRFPIYIGNAQGANFKRTVGFPNDGTPNTACTYGKILEIDGGNACGKPFTLLDGFEYVWNGCGGDTWVTWRNTGSESAAFLLLGNCVWRPQTWKCGDVTVNGNWLCPGGAPTKATQLIPSII